MCQKKGRSWDTALFQVHGGFFDLNLSNEIKVILVTVCQNQLYFMIGKPLTNTDSHLFTSLCQLNWQ
jgi:hypothetical protein